MNSITNNQSKIYIGCFNPKIYYGTMSNHEKASRQNKKYYAKYKYLESINSSRKVMLLTFTTKNKNIHKIQDIKTKFLSFIKTDKNIKNTFNYIWTIELGKNKNNPHLHFIIWYDEVSYERLSLHYQKTIKKFNLVKKWSKLTEQKKVSAYILKEFSILNKDFEEYYVARKEISKRQNKHIRFIGFSSFKQTEKVYKKSYNLYYYNYLKTDKLINFGELILWDKKYLIKKNELYPNIIYLLMKYKKTYKKDIIYQCLNNSNINNYFTLSIKLNKAIKILRIWQFPLVYYFD